MPIELTEKDFEDVPAFELSEQDFLEEPVPVPAAVSKPAEKTGLLDLGLEEWVARKLGMKPKPSGTQAYVFPSPLPSGGMIGVGAPPVAPTESMLPVPLPKTPIRAKDLPINLPETAGAYTAEAINQALGLGQFATSSLGVAGMAGGLTGLGVAAGTTADIARQIPELARRAGEVSARPEATEEEKAQAYLGLAAPIAMPAIPMLVGGVIRGSRGRQPAVIPGPAIPDVESIALSGMIPTRGPKVPALG